MTRAAASDRSIAERYIDEALAMIDRSGGSSGVNLREVSRSLGFAHTNAYNYFESLEDLLWRARAEAFERQAQQAKSAMKDAPAGADGALDALIGSQIDFALEHPGWFRFVWLEPLPGVPPEPMASALARAGVDFVGIVARLSTAKLSKMKTMEMADLFHTFLHGAACKVVANRVHSDDPKEVRRKFVLDVRRVFRMLTHEYGGSRRGRRALLARHSGK